MIQASIVRQFVTSWDRDKNGKWWNLETQTIPRKREERGETEIEFLRCAARFMFCVFMLWKVFIIKSTNENTCRCMPRRTLTYKDVWLYVAHLWCLEISRGKAQETFRFHLTHKFHWLPSHVSGRQFSPFLFHYPCFQSNSTAHKKASLSIVSLTSVSLSFAVQR